MKGAVSEFMEVFYDSESFYIVNSLLLVEKGDKKCCGVINM